MCTRKWSKTHFLILLSLKPWFHQARIHWQVINLVLRQRRSCPTLRVPFYKCFSFFQLDDSNQTINKIFGFFPSSAESGNNWTKCRVKETQPVTSKTAYSSVATTLVSDFWCFSVFHPQHFFLAPTPPLFGLLLALGKLPHFILGCHLRQFHPSAFSPHFTFSKSPTASQSQHV